MTKLGKHGVPDDSTGTSTALPQAKVQAAELRFPIENPKIESPKTPTAFMVISTLLLSGLILFMGYTANTGSALLIAKCIAGWVTAFSALSLFIKTIPVFMNKNIRLIGMQFFRPLTLLIVSGIAVWLFNLRENEALKFLTAQADLATSRCNAAGKCPERLAGWVEHGSGYEYKFTDSSNTVFYMRYRANGDVFRISINYGLDTAYMLQGGVNRPLSKK